MVTTAAPERFAGATGQPLASLTETSVKVVVTETGNAMGLPLVYEL